MVHSLRVICDSSVPLVNYDPSDLGSLIQIQTDQPKGTHHKVKKKVKFNVAIEKPIWLKRPIPLIQPSSDCFNGVPLSLFLMKLLYS